MHSSSIVESDSVILIHSIHATHALSDRHRTYIFQSLYDHIQNEEESLYDDLREYDNDSLSVVQ